MHQALRKRDADPVGPREARRLRFGMLVPKLTGTRALEGRGLRGGTPGPCGRVLVLVSALWRPLCNSSFLSHGEAPAFAFCPGPCKRSSPSGGFRLQRICRLFLLDVICDV